MSDPTPAAPQDGASIHTENHEDVQSPGTAKIKRRPRVDGKWEWVSAYNLDLKTLDGWLLKRFNGDYGLPDYDTAPKSKRRKGRVAVTEDYYRIILPQGLTNDERAEIDRLREQPKEEGGRERDSDEEEGSDTGLYSDEEDVAKGHANCGEPHDNSTARSGPFDEETAQPLRNLGSDADTIEKGPSSDIPPQ